jgi:broad specificity phosphatase PhoE
VTRGLRAVMAAEGRGRRALVVTSGGPIAVAVRLALGLGDEVTLRLAWVVGNASTTELRWRGEEVSLFGFNHLHHLPPPQRSYR